MTLLLGECKKLYTRRYIAIIALIVFLNGFLIIQGKYSEGIEKTAVAQVYEDMADMSLTEAHIWLDTRCELLRIDFMQEALPLEQLRDIISEESLQIYAEQGCTLHYCTDSSAEYNLLHYVQEQITEAEQYPQYLENMQQSAKRMTSSSLFGNVSSFSNRNIAKTAKKYAGLRSQLAINNGVGIEELMASGWTDCLMVLLLTSGALLLILSDRENNMQILLQTTQCGRTAIFRAKYVVLILHTLLMTCLLIGSKAILVQLLYGFGDLSLPIQSIPAYLQSVLPCSVGKVLFAWLLAKTAVYWVFASIAFCFSTCLRKSVWALFSSVLGCQLYSNSAAGPVWYILPSRECESDSYSENRTASANISEHQSGRLSGIKRIALCNCGGDCVGVQFSAVRSMFSPSRACETDDETVCQKTETPRFYQLVPTGVICFIHFKWCCSIDCNISGDSSCVLSIHRISNHTGRFVF